MAQGRLFRGANIYLMMAGLLSAALLFAPLAYASNFTSKIHASIYGTWVVLDTDMGAGVDFVSTKYLLQLPLHYPYALLGAALAILLLIMVFDNSDLKRKRKRIRFLLLLAVVQIGFAVLLRVFAMNYVGTSTIESSMEAGFQREFALHFFVLYFIWRCLGKLRTEQKLAVG